MAHTQVLVKKKHKPIAIASWRIRLVAPLGDRACKREALTRIRVPDKPGKPEEDLPVLTVPTVTNVN